MYPYTAKDLSQKLNDSIYSVLKHLLPNGKQRGNTYHVGSIKGESGESLSVCLQGDKKGVWSDFATGEGGDLLDLWAQNRSILIREAILEVTRYLGIPEVKIGRPGQNKYERPKLKETVKAVRYRVRDYLFWERKLEADTLAAFGILCDDDVIVFPYYRGKELILVKYLELKRTPEGKKKSWVSKGSEPCLFGWQASSGLSRKLCLTEGEIDAMSLHQYDLGMDVMSVPFGGGTKGKHRWIETEYDNLSIYDEIYLCFDGDEEGQMAARDVTERLGRHRCRIVTLPCKDANECLQKDIATVFMRECFDVAVSIDPKELKKASSYEELIKKGINHVSEKELGYSLPWTKSGNAIHFRPGELTVWTGINGHGKSQILGYVMLDQIKKGANVCVASFELRPDKTLIRMARQASGIKQPTDDHISRICQWWEDQLWVFDILGTAKADTLISVFKYAKQRYGVNVFVIDSLMKCGFSDDDYAGQKKFLDQLSDFKNEFNCHIHVVAHPRKTLDENTPPNKLDVKGVSGITDLADNCISIWRNKPKEDKINMDKAESRWITTEDSNKPDCLFKCTKQRFGDWEGTLLLWFDRDSGQYLEELNKKPVPLVG